MAEDQIKTCPAKKMTNDGWYTCTRQLDENQRKHDGEHTWSKTSLTQR